jgi:hypothetical protein
MPGTVTDLVRPRKRAALDRQCYAIPDPRPK